VQNFISEIRACSGKDEERARIDKELGKIRKKFATSDKISGKPAALPSNGSRLCA
jgi:AP-2 complex subunit alpha